MKRLFDLILSLMLLLFFIPFLFFIWIVQSVNTNSNGFFLQKRIGQYGKKFVILKFRTIHPKTSKISRFSAVLRKYKIDELPQLFNVLIGQMSFVGPRPDIPGYYDLLEGENRKILELKPGLTSEASLLFFNEERILANIENPLEYNDNVIFPQKVVLNLKYYNERSFFVDLCLIFKTISFLFTKR